ncbi:MAG: hypothetical protein GX621_06675 [Pirellulaceae bacterium]|nr:hypothetical protein [Pirellulaceae bacterium]
MRRLALALAWLLLPNLAGCGGLGWTEWCNPGTAEQQRRRAEQYDPYPQVTSQSEMAGVRPSCYDKPRPDSQIDQWPWNQGAVLYELPSRPGPYAY